MVSGVIWLIELRVFLLLRYCQHNTSNHMDTEYSFFSITNSQLLTLQTTDELSR